MSVSVDLTYKSAVVTSTIHRNIDIQKMTAFFMIIKGKMKTIVDRLHVKQRDIKFEISMRPYSQYTIDIANPH